MDDSSFGTYRELAVWQKALRLVKLVYVQIEKFLLISLFNLQPSILFK